MWLYMNRMNAFHFGNSYQKMDLLNIYLMMLKPREIEAFKKTRKTGWSQFNRNLFKFYISNLIFCAICWFSRPKKLTGADLATGRQRKRPKLESLNIKWNINKCWPIYVGSRRLKMTEVQMPPSDWQLAQIWLFNIVVFETSWAMNWPHCINKAFHFAGISVAELNI